MIAYLKGTLEYREENAVIVDVGGIGYNVTVSTSMSAALPKLGNEIKVFTHMNVKEDGISLFGFADLEELKLFHKLISVSGVGPKAALGFLSVMCPNDIIIAILSGDERALGRAPGVGKKTAQRVILELRDKFKTDAASVSFASPTQLTGADYKLEAVEALTALGYSRSEAATAISKVATDDMDTQTILKLALKGLSKF